MLAKAAAKVPDEAGLWSYEPKWDGFRCIVLRDGDEVQIGKFRLVLFERADG